MSNPQNTLTLDPHTKQFFDPAFWTGAVEARFHLSVPGLEGREFQGRVALFCTGQAMMVLQEVGKESCFVRRFPGLPGVAGGRSADVERMWRQLFVLGEPKRARGSELPVLPELSSSSGLARLHFDASSGFGFSVGCNGECHLFDLRDVESAEKLHHPLVDLAGALCSKGMAALCDMAQAEFHSGIDALLNDESTSLFQTLRFYKLSDDERAMEVFGSDYRTLKRTLKALHLVLQVALGPGGELSGSERAVWHPWHANPEIAVSCNQSESWWVDIPAPRRIAKLLEGVCAAMGCKIRLKRVGVGSKAGGASHRLAVAQEWANEQFVSGERPNAHETMEAGMKLRELLK